jgi:ABC-type transport system substrate-binding protein
MYTRRCMTGGLMAALAVGAAVAMASAAQAQAPAAPRHGGTLTMALEADFPSLDPLRISALAERQVGLAIIDPLFDVDGKGKIVPVLATGYEVLDGGRTYRVKLREGVKFHDGTPFDADAVVFNVERTRDPKNACRCLATLDNIESVKPIDAHTVEFRLKAPDAVLPAILSDSPGLIVSPTAVKADPRSVAQHPVGTGPFVLKEWQQGHKIVVERNPDYWRKGSPYLDRVVFLPLSNEESRQSSLLSGSVDVIESPSPRFITQARANKKLKVETGAGLGSVFLMMNTRTAPFDDVRVRRAIAFATNRPLFIKAIYQNEFPIADDLIGPGMWAHSPTPNFPRYDPRQARKLLAEYGKPVSFTLGISASPYNTLAAQAFQEMWKDVGINVEIKQIEQARFIRDAITHNFQMAYFRWAGRPDPDLNFYRAFHSRFADQPSSNYTQFSSRKMDELLERGRTTLDRAERQKIYDQASALLADELPYFFLFYATFHNIMSTKVHAGPIIADGVMRMHDVWVE